MKGVKDFIIQIEQPFSETIKTEGGLEIFGDKRWSAEKMANRIGIVISAPICHNTVIKEGYQVLVDPTILYEQVYHLTGGRQDSVFLVDKTKMYYKVDPNMVVLYRENSESEWKGYHENAIYEAIADETAEEPLENLFIYIPKTIQTKFKKNRVTLKFGNETILNQIAVGQELIVKEQMGIDFYINGKTYLWYRNSDVIAAVN